MRIGAFIDNRNIPYFDIDTVNNGNPGIGGTEYMFFALLYNLSLRGYYVLLYSSKEFTSDVFNNIVVENASIAIERSDIDSLDFFLLRNGVNHPVFTAEKKKTKFIMWCHNYLEFPELENITRCENIVANVFVSRQMYDRYIDHDIINKSTYIYNFLNTDIPSNGPANNKRVMYIGALVPGKGFHMLAKVWPKVLKKHHEAKLLVMGSGTLYNRQLKLGEIPIADDQYLQLIKTSLGESIHSVEFLGNVSENKTEIIKDCQIGVVNPTGATETFCISAVDFEICSIPVVTCKRNGLLDVVQNDTGILIRTEKQLAKAIIQLLDNYDTCRKLGDNGKRHASANFNIPDNVTRWINLLESIKAGERIGYIQPSSHLMNNLKWLKIVNRKVRKILKLSDRFSLSYYRYLLLRITNRI